jgi:hypothetical protein
MTNTLKKYKKAKSGESVKGSQGRKSFVVSVESKNLYMDEINCHHLAERFSRANFFHYCLYDK